MNKNANSVDVRRLTRTTIDVIKSTKNKKIMNYKLPNRHKPAKKSDSVFQKKSPSQDLSKRLCPPPSLSSFRSLMYVNELDLHSELIKQCRWKRLKYNSRLNVRVDMVGTIHDDLLTQWRHIPMGQFRANIFLIRTTSNYLWASEVFKN